jgi:hypothetical protein
MTPDFSAARTHLQFLTGEEDPRVAWQVFHDGKSDARLARGRHGRLGELADWLAGAQNEGCGVFVAVNETNGKSRQRKNVVAYHAMFLDFDGTPLPAEWPIAPGLLVNSSPGKYQVWWRVQPGNDFAAWTALELELIARYGADPKCGHIAQVGRCAGFWHLKNTERPHQVQIIQQHDDDPLDLNAFAAAFEVDLDAAREKHAHRLTVREGEAEAPAWGWDHGCDVLRAKRFLAVDDNWRATSDGGVSVFKAACRLRDFGISPRLAEELIRETIPVFPSHWPDNYIALKVSNAYRYAKRKVGEDSTLGMWADYPTAAPHDKPACKPFRFTPYDRRDPSTIPPRSWLYKPLLIRKYVTGTLAHGGVGKSSILLAHAMACASGIPLLGIEPRNRLRVCYWNGEDPMEELARRIEAVCKHYGLPTAATDGRLFVDSGRALPIDLVALDQGNRMAVPRDTGKVVAALQEAQIDALIIDPFIACHSVPENANEAIESVAQQLNLIAEQANCAVHVAHHAIKKRGSNVEAMDYRGGGAALAKLRGLQVLNTMTGTEADAAQILRKDAWRHIKAEGGKANLAPPEEARWYFMTSVSLGNVNTEEEADIIGVPITWDYVATGRRGMSPDQLDKLYREMAGDIWAKGANSPRWIGISSPV